MHTWGDEGLYDHRLVYDLEAKRTVVTNSLGHATTYQGNENGLVVETWDARGGVTLTEYNEFNEVVKEADALGNTTTYAYDEHGNCLLLTDPDGATLQRAYDAQGRLTTATNAVGGQWQWTYDLAGNQLTETDPLGLMERCEYAGGLLHRLINIAGETTNFSYDAAGNLSETRNDADQYQRWLYDQWGRIRKFTDERGNVQWREYDLLNRVTIVNEPDGNVRAFAYDGCNNVIRSTDRQHDVQYAYRGLSRLIRRVEAGTAIEFLHDTEEQLRAIVNEHGLAYRFELDGEGEVVTETGFDGLTRRYERDAGGRVLTVTLPTGQQTRYTYDPANRLTKVVYGDGRTEYFVYRPDGALLEATNDTLSVTFARDVVGNVLRETQGAHTVISTYNNKGQRAAVTSSLGANVRYTRDQVGRVAQVKAGSWQALVERDAQGLELQRTLSGGVFTQWRRNALGLPTEQCISTSWSRPKWTRTYSWQANDRLMQIQDSQSGLARFTHDATGNLAATVFGDGTVELRQPDAVGNLFRAPTRQDQRYGPAGQLLEASGLRYAYDATGNLVSKTTPQGQEWRYSWNSSGYLSEVLRPDGKIVRFTYDALGRRVSKSFEGQTTQWVWDGDVILHEWNVLEPGTTSPPNAKEIVTWIFEEDSFTPTAKINAGTSYSVVSDHLGTPIALYDINGTLTWQAQLDSYGAVRSGQGHAQDCPFRYQGQYEDIETGLYYNRFRYYDPAIGQYISQDPSGLGGQNSTVYAYAKDTNQLVDFYGLDVSNGIGRDHVTYRGIKGGKPYTGYASAPSSLNLSKEEIISRRYNGNFDKFGGTAPTPVYHGQGKPGKQTARGLEQHYFEKDVAQHGRKNVANRQNPVGAGNKSIKEYTKAKNKHLSACAGAK